MNTRPSPSAPPRPAPSQDQLNQPLAQPNQLPAVTQSNGGAQGTIHPPRDPAPPAPPVVAGPIDKIAGAVAAVMAEVGVVAKDGVNQFHKYRYATVGDVLFKVTPLMGKQGLMVTQSEVKKEFDKGRMMVEYDFTIAHKSGQLWPEKLRKTGMCIAVDSKGNWDDKAPNKCATSARKYFLLELFQIPTGDMDDADEGPAAAPAPQQRRPSAPGPEQQAAPQAAPSAPAAPAEPEAPANPFKVTLPKGSGATEWVKAYVRALDWVKEAGDITIMEEVNNNGLDAVYNNNPDLYTLITEATQRRMHILSGGVTTDGEVIDAPQQEAAPEEGQAPTTDMPDPKAKFEDFVAWVRGKFAAVNTMEEGLVLYQNAILPFIENIAAEDFDVIQGEFDKMEMRFAP